MDDRTVTDLETTALAQAHTFEQNERRIAAVRELARRAEQAGEELKRANRLLSDAESVIFEGVREDALTVTGCDTWDEVQEDADEVRWNILGHLGIKIVDRKPEWNRLGRAEAAEADRDRLQAELAQRNCDWKAAEGSWQEERDQVTRLATALRYRSEAWHIDYHSGQWEDCAEESCASERAIARAALAAPDTPPPCKHNGNISVANGRARCEMCGEPL
jgi:hypothetical protein